MLILTCLLPGCTGEELEVMPQQTCDTKATVQIRPACGLVLILENGQALIPANVTILAQSSSDEQQYTVNGFTVKENQQVIVGYVQKGPAPNFCATGTQLVDITCIVGYQVQS